MLRTVFSSILFLSFAFCLAQPGGRVARPMGVKSPEVMADKSVIFRFIAPGAKEVKLSAQFLKEPKSMNRDSLGIWTIRTEPVKPDLYPYCFIVDGIQVSDPNNIYFFPNERFKNSLVDIPGDAPLLYEAQNVPHGNVTYRYYKSKSLDLIRPLVIYTPPDYDKNRKVKYPVLYLIHGMTDTEETWFKVGHVNMILDNLIALGLARPMIIIMPYANPLPALQEKNKNTDMNVLNTDYFSNDLINDILPFVESNYRVYSDSQDRAIAGFSLGGRQTLAAGLGNPDKFNWVCAFSPAIFANELQDNFKNKYASPELINKNLKLMWVSCGKDDGLYNAAVQFTSLLKDKGIRYQTFFSDGGHTWMNCRLYISEVAKLLFK